MSAYEKVKAARASNRPTAKDFIENIFEGFIELHGDRCYGDDNAMICGLAWLDEIPVTVIGTEKGTHTKERVMRNFGSAHPEGYRKARRQMELAEKFGRPVICLIDTSGAYCGLGAEERGQGEAIAQNLMQMMGLKVPVVSVVIGEGGSGGALALGVADEVWMLENSIYSVISPEGCASILWKDAKRVVQASECLKLTPQDLMEMEIIERIFEEGEKQFEHMKSALTETVLLKQALPVAQLLDERYAKYRKIGAKL